VTGSESLVSIKNSKTNSFCFGCVCQVRNAEEVNCPNEYSGDEVEADSFESRLFPPRLLLLLLLLSLFYNRKVESRFAADQDPADGFRGASYRECGYGPAWDQPCRRSPPASPTSVDFPLNLNRALITLFTFSEKRSNESQSRSRLLLPRQPGEKSLIN